MSRKTKSILLACAVACGLTAAALALSARRAPEAPPAVPAVSEAILVTCRAMYPTQLDLEQACLRRWTTGEPMPGPTTMSRDAILVQWCSGLVGIPALRPIEYRLPPETLARWLECLRERS
jgi:hypothetical protein